MSKSFVEINIYLEEGINLTVSEETEAKTLNLAAEHVKVLADNIPEYVRNFNSFNEFSMSYKDSRVEQASSIPGS